MTQGDFSVINFYINIILLLYQQTNQANPQPSGVRYENYCKGERQ